MIIDSHQHFWKFDPVRDAWIDDSMEKIRRDFLPHELKNILKNNKVDGCVAVQADQSESETRFLLRLADENTFIRGVVGWVDLCSPDASDRLRYFNQDPYFKGVRHIVQAESEGFMRQKSFQQGIKSLRDYNLTYDILIKDHQLNEAVELVQNFPDQVFILDHLAKPNIKDNSIDPWTSDINKLAQFPNVYCKLSGMVTEAEWNSWKPGHLIPYMEVVIEAFGASRLMFGSDWPVCTLAADYETVLKQVQSFISSLSESEQEKILSGNAKRVYHLKI